jgi:hypothetical protein
MMILWPGTVQTKNTSAKDERAKRTAVYFVQEVEAKGEVIFACFLQFLQGVIISGVSYATKRLLFTSFGLLLEKKHARDDV